MVQESALPRSDFHGDIVYSDGLGEYADAREMGTLVQLALPFLRFGPSNEPASELPFPIAHAWHGFGCWRERLWLGDVHSDARNDDRADIDIAAQ